MDFDPANKMCSFCARQGTRDTEFVGGLGAMICLECLDHFHTRVHTDKDALRRPPWDDMTDAQLLTTLPRILATADQVDRFATEWVELLRERGISWAEIGGALGISRQAAWERFVSRGSVERSQRGRAH